MFQKYIYNAAIISCAVLNTSCFAADVPSQTGKNPPSKEYREPTNLFPKTTKKASSVTSAPTASIDSHEFSKKHHRKMNAGVFTVGGVMMGVGAHLFHNPYRFIDIPNSIIFFAGGFFVSSFAILDTFFPSVEYDEPVRFNTYIPQEDEGTKRNREEVKRTKYKNSAQMFSGILDGIARTSQYPTIEMGGKKVPIQPYDFEASTLEYTSRAPDIAYIKHLKSQKEKGME